ncbi:MAG TPA: phosphoribosylaminoimidazolesuccinocarboxamide synthase [Fimbriimonadales bacterium]|nr:phosphoribosylaminoimidazolesuccinocarboxamide synthase [Fimbriimonadales bacterium]
MLSITQISSPTLRPIRSGKVREIFDLGDELLMVATDRVSAFDVVLPTGIPDKGKILNQLSAFWFRKLEHIVRHHMITIDDEEIARRLGQDYDETQFRGRCMLVEKCEPYLLECVARRFITGSLYKEYLEAGGVENGAAIHGIFLPKGLRKGDELPETIFTPATKAQSGHDENIDFEEAKKIVGKEIAEKLRDITLRLFDEAREICANAGILLVDTKFEFGERNGEIVWIDEALTPDSSRFWSKADYKPGEPPESLDKQFIRDYLESIHWDKTPPGPELPAEVVEETRARYFEIFRRITGKEPIL